MKRSLLTILLMCGLSGCAAFATPFLVALATGTGVTAGAVGVYEISKYILPGGIPTPPHVSRPIPRLNSRQVDAISQMGEAIREMEDAFGQDHPDVVMATQDYQVLLNEDLQKEGLSK